MSDQPPKAIWKIAPGENAKYWPECLANGYICVGWDEVGNLREFISEEEFQNRFFKEYLSSLYDGNRGTTLRKSRELWKLMEIKVGDLVIANQGTQKILAIGEVNEPGYEWRDERSDMKHTVCVKWDTSYACQIDKQGFWGTVTIAPVPTDLYNRIITKTRPAIEAPVEVDQEFVEIADALDRKGQVILYGPPGTGKTYTARRFSVWWLLQRMGDPDSAAILADDKILTRAEQRLTSASSSARTWWVVANPKQWNWDTLFKDGYVDVDYRYGRIQKNYPLVQPNDLVIGYQATPDKRIVALATIESGLYNLDDGGPWIKLKKLAQVENGLTYEELATDPFLKQSEPMRFRSQGTLFALTEEESEHLLSLLVERDPELGTVLAPKSRVSHLTRVTFHGSYSYEDFIEGFRPVDRGTSNLVLRLEDGVFKRVCRQAQLHPDKPFLVVIDEINRANIAKVFGELVTLIEKDKRGMMITLPQSREPFTVPDNVFILGTMNSADRSVKLIDAALRRRFAFIEFMPDVSLLRGATVGSLDLGVFLEELNRRIATSADREKQIGHSFLLHRGTPINDIDEFCRRFRQEILPLLQECCYEDYSTLADYLGDKLVNRKAQTLNAALLWDAKLLVEALAEELAGPAFTAV